MLPVPNRTCPSCSFVVIAISIYFIRKSALAVVLPSDGRPAGGKRGVGWGLSVMPSDRRVAHSIITRRPSVPTAPPNAHTHIHPSHYYPSHIHPASRRVSSYPLRSPPSPPTFRRSGCLRYVGEWWTGHVGAVRSFRFVQRSGGRMRRKVRARTSVLTRTTLHPTSSYTF